MGDTYCQIAEKVEKCDLMMPSMAKVLNTLILSNTYYNLQTIWHVHFVATKTKIDRNNIYTTM